MAGGENFAKSNHQDFDFTHGLAHHPLFSLQSLKELALRIPRNRNLVCWQNGRAGAHELRGSNAGQRLTIEQTIDGIERNDSLVVLKHADYDPIFGPMLQEMLQRIWRFMPPDAQDDILLGESLICLNSPRRTAPYHIDLDSNFLVQVRGIKHVRAFDRHDRRITPYTEVENHYGGTPDAAVHKPDHDADAHTYELRPGQGIHFPTLAPHWMQNGDEASVSININFTLASVQHHDREIYRVNRLLRRAGLEPVPPGESKLRDAFKIGLSRGITHLQKLRRSRKDAGRTSYPVWRPTRKFIAVPR